jgi:hypothetical protein
LTSAASESGAAFAQRYPRAARAAGLACLVLLHAVPARAMDWGFDETRSALRLSVSVDVFRVPGTVAASARYGGTWNAKAGTWLHNNGVDPSAPSLLLGAGYMLTVSRFRFGLGVAWIDSVNLNVNGTRWNVDASIAYDLSDRWFVEYQHYSHGAILGVKDEVSNGGWNLLGVGASF